MSPSKSFKYDSFAHSGELILLQKLEEVGTSVKVIRHSTVVLILYLSTKQSVVSFFHYEMLIYYLLQRVQSLIEEQHPKKLGPID